MGIFGKREAGPPTPSEAEPTPERRATPVPPEPEPVREEPARPAAAASSSMMRPGTYGIQQAIELMRKLPNENVALVVEVVKKTLESLHVDIGAIIEDAERKQTRIEERVAKLDEEIADYEEEIAARREEIAALNADGEETRTVRERLELAHRGVATMSSSHARDTQPPINRPTPVPRPSAFSGTPPRPPLDKPDEHTHD